MAEGAARLRVRTAPATTGATSPAQALLVVRRPGGRGPRVTPRPADSRRSVGSTDCWKRGNTHLPVEPIHRFATRIENPSLAGRWQDGGFAEALAYASEAMIRGLLEARAWKATDGGPQHSLGMSNGFGTPGSDGAPRIAWGSASEKQDRRHTNGT